MNRARSVRISGAGRPVCHWWTLPGNTAMKNAAMAAPTRRRSRGKTTSAAPSMSSTTPDAMMIASVSSRSIRVVHSGTTMRYPRRPRERWDSPAPTSTAASNSRPIVRATSAGFLDARSATSSVFHDDSRRSTPRTDATRRPPDGERRVAPVRSRRRSQGTRSTGWRRIVRSFSGAVRRGSLR